MVRRFWLTTGIVALIAVAGYSLWVLREPLGGGWRTVRQSVSIGPTVRFAVVGDNHGATPMYRQIINDIKGQRLDFLLNLADTSNEGSRAEFQAVQALESTLPFPVAHVVGSHDIKADPTRQTFTSVFGHAPWYSQNFGRLHVILLDNADRLVGFPAASLDWLARDLAAHRGQLTVIAYHRPFDLPLATLLGDDETSASRKTNERFLSILQSSPDVKEVFTAHLHTYLPYTLGGVPAVVSGGGGVPAQSVLGGPPNNFFHYLIVTVRGQNFQIEVRRVQLTATAE